MENSNTFDKEKFKETLHYIVSKTGNISNVGKTVIFKILYFSDFDFYELNQKPITGETYRKIEMGPAPMHFESAASELKSEGKIREFKTDHGGFKNNLTKFVSLQEPKITLLSSTEIELINKVIKRLSGMGAKQISGYSHEDLPWKATADKSKIDYKLVFYRSPAFSVSEEVSAD